MSTNTNSSADWVGSTRTMLLAWGLPHAALVAGLLVAAPARTAIWVVALAWMGVACILNARRCGRTHCRFTGPYYLVTIIPVLALGLAAVPVGLSGWLVLGAFMILGDKTIWWATERARGRFSETAETFIMRTVPTRWGAIRGIFQAVAKLSCRAG